MPPPLYDEIVWIQTAFIGDIVITTGVCAELKRSYPAVRQHLITTPVGASALSGCEIFDSIISFDKRKQSFWAASKQVKHEIAARIAKTQRAVILQPHRSFRSSLLARRLGMTTICFSDAQLKFLANKTVYRDTALHESMRVASLLGGIGIQPASFKIQSPWMKPIEASRLSTGMQGIQLADRLIGIAPGSVWGTKKWLNSGFSALTQQLLRAYPHFSIVLIGGPDEIEDCHTIEGSVSTSDRSRVINLCGRTSLSDLRWLVPKLSLLISNDSSPVHYASSFNIPTVAIFGATTPELGFGPLAERSRVTEIDLKCRPCSSHGPMICPLGHFDCMKKLSAETVFGACRSILG